MRKFDLLDYYTRIKISPDYLLRLIRKNLNNEEYVLYRTFMARYKNDKGLNIRDTINSKHIINNREVTINGKKVNLQGKQFDMLEYLLNSKNMIITKDQIFDKIWGFDSETTTNVIEVYASGIRKELKKYGYDKYLKTIRGVGYIWNN